MKKFILIFSLFFGFENFYCNSSKDESVKKADQTTSDKKGGKDSNKDDYDEEDEEDEEDKNGKKIKKFKKEDCEKIKKEIKEKIKKSGKIICYYNKNDIINKKITKKMNSLVRKFQNKNIQYIKKIEGISQELDKNDMHSVKKFMEVQENFKSKVQIMHKPFWKEILEISKKVSKSIFDDNSKVLEVKLVVEDSELSNEFLNPESSVDVTALFYFSILENIDLDDEKFNRVPKLDIDDLEVFQD